MKGNHNTNDSYNFELFFELSADLLCIAGFDGFFKRINLSVSKLLGYSNEELLSKPINEFIHFEDREITSQARERLIKNDPLLHFENRYLTKMGDIVWLSWTSIPVEKDKLVFAVAKNITHKKKLEEERNSFLLELTKYNETLKHLTFTTAHDLRSPVNILLSIHDILDISKITDPETLQFIGFLKSTTESLQQNLNNLVDTLIQKEHLKSKVEELDLRESLDFVLNSINYLIENSKTTVNINFSELEKIIFNKNSLESIFLNLITNSIKYSRHDCLPIISIYSRKNNGIPQLIVSDNGLGFDMDTAKGKIFELNQKFHNHIDSKGVGLYLVYNHVISLGGRIEIESEVNGGAKFIISFKN
jgi:PAS domain S-box-containing protein